MLINNKTRIKKEKFKKSNFQTERYTYNIYLFLQQRYTFRWRAGGPGLRTGFNIVLGHNE